MISPTMTVAPIGVAIDDTAAIPKNFSGTKSVAIVVASIDHSGLLLPHRVIIIT